VLFDAIKANGNNVRAKSDKVVTLFQMFRLIEDSDVTGFRVLLRRMNKTAADVLIESNGGEPESKRG
jgi:hypothetical protein